jgi:hypothetical protein
MSSDRVASYRLPKEKQNASESRMEKQNPSLSKYLQHPQDTVDTLQKGGKLTAGGALVVSCSSGANRCEIVKGRDVKID